MKYFTSEWYEMCQNANWHLNMSVSKNAEEFSEEYYKSVGDRYNGIQRRSGSE